jgi:hypothetical protein
VDVFEWTVPGAVTADDVVRRGTRIGTVRVNAPKDPDEPEPAAEDPAREGVEQDTVATVTDPLAADADAQGGYRAYVAVGFNGRGRRGMLSPRVSLPLVPLPPPPGEPRVSYDEKAITVTWPPAAPADGTTFTYTVYRPDPVALLTPTPVRNAQFVDESIEWDAERCYEVRTVATVEGVRIESLPSAPHCVTLQDTFAPKKPEGLVGVGSESAISLIWTANTEVDLAGYVVLRAIEPATQLTPVTPAPIADTNYRDTVPAGSRVTYAVLAVDKAGNRSAPSDRITETAR